MESSFKVAVRCRPPIGKEDNETDEVETIYCSPENKQVIADKLYVYDYVFDCQANQGDVYDSAVASVIEKFLSGQNAAVVAYGQTGSGKTYTMGIAEDSLSSLNEELVVETEGVLPRTLRRVFEHVKRADIDGATKKIVKVSFMEVYANEAHDLLDPNRSRVSIREDSHSINLWGLREVIVKSFEEAKGCLADGIGFRKRGSTAMNQNSSRSHAIFIIESDNRNKLMLVDLAGSESVRRTNARGQTLKEGANINLGLMALKEVIQNLRKGQRFISYRNSVLTRILQVAFQETCHTLIITCISPLRSSLPETINALQFATEVSGIRCKGNLHQSLYDRGTFSRHKYMKLGIGTPITALKASSAKRFCTGVRPVSENSGRATCSDIPEFQLSASEELPETPARKWDQRTSNSDHADFKKPTTPLRQVSSQLPITFTPYVKRICDGISSSLNRFADKLPPPIVKLDTPTRNTIVDSVINKIEEMYADRILKDFSPKSNRTLTEHDNKFAPKQLDYDSFVGGMSFDSDDEVISGPAAMRCRRASRRKVPVSVAGRSTRSKRRANDENISVYSVTSIRNKDISRYNAIEHSIVMSPSGTRSKHANNVLHLLNTGTVTQLKLLPRVGQKSALIIHNWRIQNGPLKSVSDIELIPGLSTAFTRAFISANMCDG